ncbi:MAG: hypothetical protein GXO98_05535, partial [Nitrospirae bacterium]|nr:hypothetical protein [Nitrospirota bacterium]
MAKIVNRRKCRRFEIPGGKVRYRGIRLLTLLKGFSKSHPMVSISKGGVAFVCQEKFSKGQEIITQLLVPNKTPLNLRARVQWQDPSSGNGERVVGVEFQSFGPGKDHNSYQALEILRKLDVQYGNSVSGI